MAVSEELKIVVKAEVDRAIADLKKLQGQTTKNTKGVKKFVTDIKKMALAIGGAAAVVALFRKGFKFSVEAAKLASDATQVEMAFNSMARRVGESGAQVLAELSEAAGGAIDSLALMKQRLAPWCSIYRLRIFRI